MSELRDYNESDSAEVLIRSAVLKNREITLRSRCLRRALFRAVRQRDKATRLNVLSYFIFILIGLWATYTQDLTTMGLAALGAGVLIITLVLGGNN